jgi:hypothetical protein
MLEIQKEVLLRESKQALQTTWLTAGEVDSPVEKLFGGSKNVTDMRNDHWSVH